MLTKLAPVILFLIGLAIGRFTAPESTKIDSAKAEIKNQSRDKEQDFLKTITTTCIEKPDGTKLTRNRTTFENKVKSNTEKTSVVLSTEKKEIIARRGVVVSLLFGAPLTLSASSFVGGASFSAPIIGGIYWGLWGLVTPKVYGGLSVGLEF